MAKLWKGRFHKELNAVANDFNSSIRVDSRMIKEDILGSIAHATMLGKQGIIPPDESKKLVEGLTSLLEQLQSGVLEIDYSQEDVHSFVELKLTEMLGDTGKRLHTARSRNDQVALDTRMYLGNKSLELRHAIVELIATLTRLAARYDDCVMCGYTHLQRAQPITFAHHLLAYAFMLVRDEERLQDCQKRTSSMPLGSSALAGTSYPIDRLAVAEQLGFSKVTENSLDGVSDRDFVIELCSTLAIVMMHLSRFAEEIILWSSWEFKYIELSDEYSTGSSIMPQKKNPDIAELIRGKTGRVYGNLMSILTVMKGLPLAYNKDMQEDKEGVFDSIDTVLVCLNLFKGMLDTLTVNRENMLKSGEKGYINATDCADYLTKKGMPFRDAYKLTGEIVAYAVEKSCSLNDLPLSVYREKSPLFQEDIFEAIKLEACLEKRTSYGAPSKQAVAKQIELLSTYLAEKGVKL